MNYPIISKYIEAIKVAELHGVRCFLRYNKGRTVAYLQISEELENIALVFRAEEELSEYGNYVKS